jgi:hypothetical protein
MTSELARTDRERQVALDNTLKYLGLDPASIPAQALVLVCRRYGLDALLGHIDVILTPHGPRIYISRDGMLEIAHRSGVFDGITVDEERRNSDNDGWTAYVSVWRKDMAHPFRYGAQCKDSEPQAKAGNGPAMALARAERRALRRAFNIPVTDDLDEPAEQIPGPVPATPVAPGETEPLPSRPTGPGPTTRSRKPARPRLDTPPLDYYDDLPEARGLR